MVVDTFKKLKEESGDSSEAALAQLQYLRAMCATAVSEPQSLRHDVSSQMRVLIAGKLGCRAFEGRLRLLHMTNPCFLQCAIIFR